MKIEEKSKNMNDIQNTGSDNRQGHVKFNGIYCAVTGIMIEANATVTGIMIEANATGTGE